MPLDIYQTARANAEAQAIRSPARGDDLVHLDWAAVFTALGIALLVIAFIAWAASSDCPRKNASDH